MKWLAGIFAALLRRRRGRCPSCPARGGKRLIGREVSVWLNGLPVEGVHNVWIERARTPGMCEDVP